MIIVILDAATLGLDLDLTPFNEFGDVTIYQCTNKNQLEKHAAKADILILNKVALGEEQFKLLPNLKLICLTATGFDNIDVAKAKQYGVVVTNVKDYSTNSVAQHTFSMLLYQLQHMKYYDNYIKEKSYKGLPVFTYIEKDWNEISGKNWGIIGLGTIGKSVAKIATSFGANVFYYSTTGIKRTEEYKELGLKEMLTTCDFISIHAPLNNKTEDLISYEEFKLAKKNLIILNLGRGGIINETALAEALDENMIRGACVDVLTSEPVNHENPLINIKNKDKLLITPHIAWGSIESRNKVISEICKNIEAFNTGELRNRV